MSKILNMLKMQDGLNNSTNGDDWKQGITTEGKHINWKRYAVMETAELIESYPYKHWKDLNAEPDYGNAKVEVVDIWHFIMSFMLEKDYREHPNSTLEESLNRLNKSVKDCLSFNAFASGRRHCMCGDRTVTILTAEDLMRALLDRDTNVNTLLVTFFTLAGLVDLDLESLYELYMAKNILNEFRQNNGYKDGSYTKIWRGEEDNVVMQRVIAENPEFTSNELYSKLEETYNNL